MSIEVNGVTLPDIPSEVLEQYPYAFVVRCTGDAFDGLGENYYAYFASAEQFIYMSSALTGMDNAGMIATTGQQVYAYGAVSVGWQEMTDASGNGHVIADGTYNGGFLADLVDGVLEWSNHDILEVVSVDADTGTFTTGTAWFPSSVSDPNYYAPKSWFDGMARQVMRLTGTSDKLPTDEMLEDLKGVEMLGSGTGYKVTFISDGVEIGTSFALDGQGITAPSVTPADGYEVTGWYTDELYTEAISFPYEPNADIVLYAKQVEIQLPAADSLTGVWVFNETVATIGNDEYNVNFTSNGLSCMSIRGYNGTTFSYNKGTIPSPSYKSVYSSSSGWTAEAYRTVDFGTTGQSVSDTFYEWLTSNAVYQGASA